MKTLTVTKNTLEGILTTFIYCQNGVQHYHNQPLDASGQNKGLRVVGVPTPERIKRFRINSIKASKFDPDKYCDQSFIFLDCSPDGTSQIIPGVLLPEQNTVLFPQNVLRAYKERIFNNPDLQVYVLSDIMQLPHSPKCELSLIEYYGQSLDWLSHSSGFVFQRILREYNKPKKEKPKREDGFDVI